MDYSTKRALSRYLNLALEAVERDIEKTTESRKRSDEVLLPLYLIRHLLIEIIKYVEDGAEESNYILSALISFIVQLQNLDAETK